MVQHERVERMEMVIGFSGSTGSLGSTQCIGDILLSLNGQRVGFFYRETPIKSPPFFIRPGKILPLSSYVSPLRFGWRFFGYFVFIFYFLFFFLLI